MSFHPPAPNSKEVREDKMKNVVIKKKKKQHKKITTMS